jgi:hypothetical protein
MFLLLKELVDRQRLQAVRRSAAAHRSLDQPVELAELADLLELDFVLELDLLEPDRLLAVLSDCEPL